MEKQGQKRPLLSVWLMFAGFTAVFVLNMGVTMDLPPTQRMWLVLDIWSVAAGAFMLVKNGMPKKKYISLSALAAGLVVVSYMEVSLFSMIKGGITTMIAALAIFSVFSRYEGAALRFTSKGIKGGIPVGIIIGAAAGLLLAVVNCILMSGGSTASPRLSLLCFTISLSPAVLEELAYRTLFYAVCINAMGRAPESRGERFTCFFMMIMPHVMVHTPSAFIEGGVIEGVITVLLYVLLFGLPFAILQRRRSVGSAMLAHGIVDCIRFILFGLPV